MPVRCIQHDLVVSPLRGRCMCVKRTSGVLGTLHALNALRSKPSARPRLGARTALLDVASRRAARGAPSRPALLIGRASI